MCFCTLRFFLDSYFFRSISQRCGHAYTKGKKPLRESLGRRASGAELCINTLSVIPFVLLRQKKRTSTSLQSRGGCFACVRPAEKLRPVPMPYIKKHRNPFERGSKSSFFVQSDAAYRIYSVPLQNWLCICFSLNRGWV